jgi:hypothetical protein
MCLNTNLGASLSWRANGTVPAVVAVLADRSARPSQTDAALGAAGARLSLGPHSTLRALVQTDTEEVSAVRALVMAGRPT